MTNYRNQKKTKQYLPQHDAAVIFHPTLESQLFSLIHKTMKSVMLNDNFVHIFCLGFHVRAASKSMLFLTCMKTKKSAAQNKAEHFQKSLPPTQIYSEIFAHS